MVFMDNIAEGLQRPLTVTIVSDQELDSSEFLRDLRTFAANLRVPRGRMLDWLADGYRDSPTILIDGQGNRAEVDFQVLERDGIEWWFKDWAKRPLANTILRVRIEARERVRVVATILRLIFPKETSVWGLGGEALRFLSGYQARALPQPSP